MVIKVRLMVRMTNGQANGITMVRAYKEKNERAENVTPAAALAAMRRMKNDGLSLRDAGDELGINYRTLASHVTFGALTRLLSTLSKPQKESYLERVETKRGTFVTVTDTISASGNTVPPFFVFPCVHSRIFYWNKLPEAVVALVFAADGYKKTAFNCV
ncbi:hypothetical protein PoB_002737700 [Plakobranchus ocellatus]|uniref:HTH psq-type domain-containing protein n=1 Tax=Plakobranchus ocellatus TaxID=259542 RepID=A0AAV4A1U2_9GAST|nr:hypothetical protein PoB_002737700 [Plakobranchus ocellatus]